MKPFGKSFPKCSSTKILSFCNSNTSTWWRAKRDKIGLKLKIGTSWKLWKWRRKEDGTKSQRECSLTPIGNVSELQSNVANDGWIISTKLKNVVDGRQQKITPFLSISWSMVNIGARLYHIWTTLARSIWLRTDITLLSVN